MATSATALSIIINARDNAKATLGRVGLDLDQLDKKAQTAGRQLNGMQGHLHKTGQAADVLGGKTQVAGKHMHNMGADAMMASMGLGIMGGAMTAAGAAISYGLIAPAANFEQTMSGVKAVSGATGEQFKQLSALALQLGKDTVYSASESAAGIEMLVKGGVQIPDILNGGAEAMMNLAAAGGVELPAAAEIAANAMNTFSLAGSDMAHVADLIAGAANASSLDVNDFRLSLSMSGAVARTVGFSFDDLAQGIAVLGKEGLKSSDAGTSLKMMMLNLQPVTKKGIEQMRSLGLITEDGGNKFFDATGKVKSMAEVAGVLQEATAGLTDQQKIMALEVMFGTDAVRAAAIMARQGSEGFNEMAAAMGKVSAAEVAQQRLDNLAGSMEQLTGSMETAAIVMGNALSPAIRSVADLLTGLVNRFLELPPGLQTTIAIFAGLVGVLGLVGGPILILISLLPMLSAGFGMLGITLPGVAAGFTAINVAMGPIGWILLGVAAAVVLLATAWSQNWGDIQGKTKAVIDFIGNKLNWLRDTVGGAVRWVIDHLGDLASYLPLLAGPVGIFSVAWSKNWFGIRDTLSSVINTILTTLRNWMDYVVSLPAKLWDAGNKMIQNLIDGIASKAEDLKNAVMGPLQGIMDLLPHSPAKEGPLTELYAGGQGIPTEIARGITDNKQALITATSTVLSETKGTIDNAQPMFHAAGIETCNSLALGIREGAPAIHHAMGETITDLRLKTLLELGNDFTVIGRDAATKLANGYAVDMASLGAAKMVQATEGAMEQVRSRLDWYVRNARLGTPIPGSNTSYPGSGQTLPTLPNDVLSEFFPLPGGMGDYPISTRMGEFSLGRYHNWGEDWAVPMNTPLYSPMAGTITGMRENVDAWGNQIEVTLDNGAKVIMSHLSSFDNAILGATVRAGQRLGWSGSTGFSTGPHLDIQTINALGQRVAPSQFFGNAEGLQFPTEEQLARAGTAGSAGSTVGAAQTIDPVEAAVQMVERLKGAIDVISSLRDFIGPSDHAVADFTNHVRSLVSRMVDIASAFSDEGLTAAMRFSEAGSSIFDFVGKAIQPILGLVGFIGPSDHAVWDFFNHVKSITSRMVQMAGEFDIKGVEAAGLFSEAATKIFNLVGAAVQPILGLVGFVGPADHAVWDFFNHLKSMTARMVTLSGQFEIEGVQAAAIFAEAVGKVMGTISAGVDAFVALQEYQGVPSEVLDSFFRDLQIAAGKMVDIARVIDTVMIEQAAYFASKTGEVFTTMKNALDLFTGLKDYEGIPGDRMDALLANIVDAMDKMSRLAVKAVTFEDDAKKFFERVWRAYWYVQQGITLNNTTPANWTPPPIPDVPQPGNGGGGGGGGFGLSVPVLDNGAIVTRPTLAVLAANGEPEGVYPLKGGRPGGNITININNPSVRDDRDIDVLVDKIEKVFSRRMKLQGAG